MCMSDQSPVVLLGAGVGLTPMVGIVNTPDVTGDHRKVSWVRHAKFKGVQAIRVGEIAEGERTCENRGVP